MGINTWVVPGSPPGDHRYGHPAREAFGISHRWTVWTVTNPSTARPYITLHACDATIASIQNYAPGTMSSSQMRIMNDRRSSPVGYPRALLMESLQIVVDRSILRLTRQRNSLRGERHHHPGCTRRRQRGYVDDRQSKKGFCLPTTCARVCAGYCKTVSW